MSRIRKHLTPAEASAAGLHSRKELKSLGLMPSTSVKPAASVWQGQSAYWVYATEHCVPWERTPGPAQLRRQQCALEAATLLNSNMVILDVESTGLGENAEIVEIALIDPSGTPLLNTLVRPTSCIPEEASAIHGITDADVASSPSWPDLADEVADITSGRYLVGYNVAFDVRMIRQSSLAHGMSPSTFEHQACAMNLFARWFGEPSRRGTWRWHTLSFAADHCRIPTQGAHRALSDCLMTLGILKFMNARPKGSRR